MPPPSASAIEECRQRLVPVLVASAHARDPGKRLHTEQCRQLLSDDHCKHFLRQAKEMKHQLSSLVSRKTPVNQSWSGSLKHDRVDDVHTWVRNTRNRFDSVSTVVSDASRRDSDITLVDFTGGRLPPKAPRAMLQAYNPTSLGKSLNAAPGEAPYKPLVASPTTGDPPASASSSIDLVQQAIKMFPALGPTSSAVTEIDTSNVPVGMLAGDPSGHPSQAVSPTHTISPTSTDFVSHLPTQAGIWFRQQGRQYAEIVDVDIDVSDEMFYVSTERRPFRLRMHLCLCSVPVSLAVAKNDGGDTPTSFQDINDAINWPKKGKLVIQVNPESERSKTWLPYTLESDPLDVTSCVQPGKNTFRFIQLSDLSEFMFVLAASPPPPGEEWRSWDWASVVERSRSGTRASSSSTAADDAMNGLSEFAHIPVTIRS
ncbi:hypothetical protein L210DRAFT_2364708 [Boletus edulis BED1]|uniref:Uncharacterized protein n=1 Tax=Boletus edulis BED1 TaxID=1328754 RepID=A0AAD4GCS7_BOLED|nr:hypothetical protein L210DRAFT_2364708 [Boletus edulis BED1]